MNGLQRVAIHFAPESTIYGMAMRIFSRGQSDPQFNRYIDSAPREARLIGGWHFCCVLLRLMV